MFVAEGVTVYEVGEDTVLGRIVGVVSERRTGLLQGVISHERYAGFVAFAQGAAYFHIGAGQIVGNVGLPRTGGLASQSSVSHIPKSPAYLHFGRIPEPAVCDIHLSQLRFVGKTVSIHIISPEIVVGMAEQYRIQVVRKTQ